LHALGEFMQRPRLPRERANAPFGGGRVAGEACLGGAATFEQRGDLFAFSVDGILRFGQEDLFGGNGGLQPAGLVERLGGASLLGTEDGRCCAGESAGAHGARLDSPLGERRCDQRALEAIVGAPAPDAFRVDFEAQQGQALLRGGGGSLGFASAASCFHQPAVQFANLASCGLRLTAQPLGPRGLGAPIAFRLRGSPACLRVRRS
jgi:hypothetical protein